jgi:hypothetical protein
MTYEVEVEGMCKEPGFSKKNFSLLFAHFGFFLPCTYKWTTAVANDYPSFSSFRIIEERILNHELDFFGSITNGMHQTSLALDAEKLKDAKYADACEAGVDFRAFVLETFGGCVTDESQNSKQ